MGWLAAKSERFDHVHESEPSGDNEFYFLSWGRKTRDEPVAYRRPPIKETEIKETDRPVEEVGAASLSSGETPVPAAGAPPRPLTTNFTSAWLSGTTIKGGTEPFANLPPIAELASEAALEEQARSQFGLGDRLPATAPEIRRRSACRRSRKYSPGSGPRCVLAKRSVRRPIGG